MIDDDTHLIGCDAVGCDSDVAPPADLDAVPPVFEEVAVGNAVVAVALNFASDRARPVGKRLAVQGDAVATVGGCRDAVENHAGRRAGDCEAVDSVIGRCCVDHGAVLYKSVEHEAVDEAVSDVRMTDPDVHRAGHKQTEGVAVDAHVVELC